jgi:hypothetical protein
MAERRPAAPKLDMLSPDIYQPNFMEWCRLYELDGNPLFIPETLSEADGARNVFAAIGNYNALGVSPFAIDSIQEPKKSAFSASYEVLASIAPEILRHQGQRETIGFVLDQQQPSLRFKLQGYEVEVRLDHGLGASGQFGYGLIVATGTDEFLGAGSGAQVVFTPKSPGPRLAGIANVDEGEFVNGAWKAGRRLNGDETNGGAAWRFPAGAPKVERCSVYRYE